MKPRKTNLIVYSTDPDFRTDTEDLPPTKTPPPGQQNLIVRLETKHRAGKVVTLVSGFSGSPRDLLALAKKLKVACGSGGSVKEGSIIIQGNFVQKIIPWLRNEGYHAKKSGG